MTMSYTRGARDVPLLEQAIGETLRRTVERFPDQEALVVAHQGYRASYAQLWLEVDRAARALIAHGVRKGDRVGIWAPNRFEWVVIQFATARVGAILVTINPAYKARELEYALRKAFRVVTEQERTLSLITTSAARPLGLQGSWLVLDNSRHSDPLLSTRFHPDT